MIDRRDDELSTMIELVSHRFTESMKVLEEQLIHSEYHAQMNSHDASTVASTPLKEYFRLLTLSVKMLLSYSGSYDQIWYHIWFINSDVLYRKAISNSINWHRWYTWVWVECVDILETEMQRTMHMSNTGHTGSSSGDVS